MRNRPRLDAPARVFSSKRTHPRFGSDGRIETALSSETQNPGHGGGPHPFDPVAAEVFTQAVKPGANERKRLSSRRTLKTPKRLTTPPRNYRCAITQFVLQ